MKSVCKKNNVFTERIKASVEPMKKVKQDNIFKKILSIKISRSSSKLRRYLTFCQCTFTTYIFSIPSLFPFIQAVLEFGPPFEGGFTAAASKKEDFWCFAGGS